MRSNYNTPTLSVIIVATDLFGPHHYEEKIIYLVMSFFSILFQIICNYFSNTIHRK